LQRIDFAPLIKRALTPIFGSIPASGRITPSIAFDFAVGPSGLTFPGDKGVAAGVTGTSTFNGTVYPGAHPPQLALPPIPTDHHLNYYISEYTINGLFWAFFKSGALKATATASNVPDPAAMNTNNYQDTPLQALYQAYPSAPITADLTALAEPTVSFASVYDVSTEALDELKSSLPESVLKLLQGMLGQLYMTEPALFCELVNVLGQSAADQYRTTIERAVQITAALVTHSIQVIMNVLWHGQTVPVLTFTVAEMDVLEDFVLGSSGTTQTLQFALQIVPAFTTAKFVSSSVPGIARGEFGYIWSWVLEPVFALVAAKIGKAGVALPRIEGFNFLFDHATITLESGYAGVLTDVKHVGDNSALYFQSKRRIQPGEPIVSPAAASRSWRVLAPPWRPRRPVPPLPAEWSSLGRA
jgi:hypothetical protein